MRYCLLLAFLIAIPLQAQPERSRRERPMPPMPAAPIVVAPGVDGLAPLLLELAKLEAGGQDWVKAALRGGATVREQSQVIVEFNANGRYTLWTDGVKTGVERHFTAAFKEKIARQFPGAAVVPTGAPTMFRAWMSPSLARPMFESIRAEYPDATAAPYRSPKTCAYGSIVSEGTGSGRMYTEWYNSLGVTGASVKVAVMDIGYWDIDTFAANEVGPYSHLPSQNDLDWDLSEHGTGCCEIIRDVAPGCELRVYRIDAALDIWDATADALAWGADIISVSLAWHEAPLEGLACGAAELALNAGSYWVNAAGNYADGAYWESNSVGLMTWGGQTYVDYDAPLGDPYQLIFDTVDGALLRAYFAYEAPSASYARFALELWRWDGFSPTLTLVASGTAGATAQSVQHTTWDSSYSYYLLLRRTQPGTIGRMRQFVRGDYAHELYFYSVRGSVANPASVPGALTIGAVNQNNYTSGGFPTAYSSRGGGLWNLPLDLCAPTQVSCYSYGSVGFAGTSAACPHMAGLLALQLSDTGLSADPLGFLFFRDQGPAGWDPDSGDGAVLGYIDNFEQNNTPGTATNLGSTSTSSSGHGISPGVDVDWFRFTLSTSQYVTLQTSGVVGGDTVVSLYTSGQVLVASDDDSGTDLYSLLAAGLLGPGTWYAKVESWNNESVVNGYTLTLTIAAVGPPGPVMLLAPAQGAQDVPLPVTLTWGAATGPGTITYTCQVATDAAFTSLAFNQSGLAVLSASPTLGAGTGYFWRVRASSQHGDGPWSTVRDFTTDDPLPGAPALVSPADSTTGVATTPILVWDAPTVGNGPFTYEVMLSTDPSFSGLTLTQGGIAATQVQISALQHGQTYYWRARASNAAGTGAWSIVFSFEVQPAPPAPPPSGGGSKKSSGGGCAAGPASALWILAALGGLALRRARRRD